MTRPEPSGTSGEREMLEGFLEWQRATIELKCAGLDADQLATRSMPPSTLSLLGLVRHLAQVERGWWARVDGGDPENIWGPGDAEFEDAVGDPAVVESAFATWRAEVVAAREVCARHALDDTFVHRRSGETLSMRWVLVHLVEEYARHNGHADLLREAIDGTVGE